MGHYRRTITGPTSISLSETFDWQVIVEYPKKYVNVETLWQLTHLLKTKKINTNIMAGQPTPP